MTLIVAAVKTPAALDFAAGERIRARPESWV
jgi:hypothetical protein